MTLPSWSPALPPEIDVLRLAQSLAKLYAVLQIVVDHRTDFLPGEACDELEAAWKHSEPDFQKLAERVLNANEDFDSHRLIGPTGQAKMSLVGHLYDRFLSFWQCTPHKANSNIVAAESAIDLFEFGATLCGSIPGGGAVGELLSLFKQALTIRARRSSVIEA